MSDEAEQVRTAFVQVSSGHSPDTKGVFYMFPPYNSLKIVHDQMIQEELERHRANEGQAPRQPGLSQTLGKVLSRFTARPERKQERLLPGGVQGESCTIV
jgi:hypothetical protein